MWHISRGIFKIQDFLTFLKLWSQNSQNMKKIPNLYKNLLFYTLKIWFFGKFQIMYLYHFWRSFTWNFQNLKFPKNFEVMGPKTGRNSGKFPNFHEKLKFRIQIFHFFEISIMHLMAFFEIFHMKFSEFKNSTYFKSYVQKTTEKVEISSSAKIAVIFEFFRILTWKFNTTILSSVTIISENLSTVPGLHSEI